MTNHYRLDEPAYVAPIVQEAKDMGQIADLPVCATCELRWWVSDRTIGLMCICSRGNHRTFPALDLGGCEKWALAEPVGEDSIEEPDIDYGG